MHRDRALLASAVALAVATAPAVRADPTLEIRDELRQLNRSVELLLQLLDREAAAAQQSQLVEQLEGLDRSIAFLDRELRDLLDTRAALEQDAFELAAAVGGARRRDAADADSLAGVIAELSGQSPTERLRGQELELYRVQERLSHVEDRIAELGATLVARRELRATLAAELERWLGSEPR